MNGPFILYKNFGRMLFRFVTFHAFERQSDGQTDGRTFRSWLRPPCIDALLRVINQVSLTNTVEISFRKWSLIVTAPVGWWLKPT